MEERSWRPPRLAPTDLRDASAAALERALAARRLAKQRVAPLATRIVAARFVLWTAEGDEPPPQLRADE